VDVIQKARERHAALKAQIEAIDAIRPEFERLGEFLRQFAEVERQFSPTGPVAINVPQQATTRVYGQAGELTADLIDRVLETYGPKMHIKAIQDRMYELGWQGSGAKQKDYKNLFENMNSKPKRFRNVGMATFEQVKEKTEQGR
jgi:hypothetical protein